MSQETYITAAQKNTSQMSQGLILQTYFNSVLQQPKINLRGVESMKALEIQINKELGDASVTANYYLNTLQSEIINNSASFQSFLALNAAVSTALPQGATTEQWIRTLQAVADEAIGYQKQSETTRNNIMEVHGKIAYQSQFLSETVSEFNVAVKGDNGLLDSVNQGIADLNRQVAGIISSIVLGALLTAAGAIVTAIGAISNFVTAGTSTSLVVGGVALMTAGAATAGGTAYALSDAYRAQSELYNTQSRLAVEVNLANALSNQFSLLQSQASQSVTAATQMSAAWQSLIGSTENYINNLKQGTISPDVLRTLYLQTANNTIPVLDSEISVIRQQMSGVSILSVPTGTSLTSYIDNFQA